MQAAGCGSNVTAAELIPPIKQRLREIQQSIAAKRATLGEGSSSTQSSTSTAAAAGSQPRFTFKRSMKSKAETTATAASDIPSSGVPSSAPKQEPVASGEAAKKDDYLQQAEAANVQVTLQSQRLFTFDDLPKATNGCDGLSLSLSHLTECVLDFRQPPKAILAIHATNLTRCVLLLPKIEGSALLTGFKQSYVIVGGCRQFRIHSSHETWVFLRSSSPATLEACSELHISGVSDEEINESAPTSNDSQLVANTAIPTSVRPEVQDFEAPDAGVGSSGTKSWSAPDDAVRASVISSVTSLVRHARNGDNAGASTTSNSHWLKKLAEIDASAKPSSPSLLLVFSDPGKDATLEEFHDWYDTEHVPLRTERFPEFRSAARYEVIESSPADAPAAFQAKWSAAYTISSNEIYKQERYTSLRSKRSPREAELLSRIAVLDRRIYTLVTDTSRDETNKADVRPRSADELSNEAHSALFVGFNSDADIETITQWLLSIELPSKTRARLFTLDDALINGRAVAKDNGDSRLVGKYALYIEHGADVGLDEVRGTLLHGFKDVVRPVGECEERAMRLYRAWDVVAALQAQG